MINVRNNYAGRKSIDIDINQTITISLRREEYDELVNKLTESMAEKIRDADAIVDRSRQKENECREFLNETREIFYEILDDIGIRREIKDLDRESLYKLLDKYNDLLGFK